MEGVGLQKSPLIYLTSVDINMLNFCLCENTIKGLISSSSPMIMMQIRIGCDKAKQRKLLIKHKNSIVGITVQLHGFDFQGILI